MTKGSPSQEPPTISSTLDLHSLPINESQKKQWREQPLCLKSLERENTSSQLVPELRLKHFMIQDFLPTLYLFGCFFYLRNLFSESVRNYSGCFKIKKASLDITSEYKMVDVLYPILLPTPKSLMSRKANFENLALLWPWKLRHISPDRHLKLTQLRPEIPKINRELLKQVSCVPCLSAKARRAPSSSSNRVTAKPFKSSICIFQEK